MSDVSTMKRGQILTSVGIRGGRGVVVGGYSVSKPVVSTGLQRRDLRAHVTYSLSVLVVRVSGVLPRRPMRRSFARSDANGRDDENACELDNIRQRDQYWKPTDTRPNA